MSGSLVVLLLCGISTGVLAWQCCHRTFLECVSASEMTYIVSGGAVTHFQNVSKPRLLNLFCVVHSTL